MLAQWVQLDMINSLGEKKNIYIHTQIHTCICALRNLKYGFFFRSGGLQLTASLINKRVD